MTAYVDTSVGLCIVLGEPGRHVRGVTQDRRPADDRERAAPASTRVDAARDLDPGPTS